MRSMLAGVVCLLIADQAAAQIRESIDVRVVELEATVLDRKGQPVHGLTRDDFIVRSGRQEIPITNFFAVRNGEILQDESSAAEPSTEPSMPLAARTSIPTSLVIFIDDTHLAQHSHARAIAALKKYVSAHVGANTIATLMRYNRTLDVRIRPTERVGPILRELDRLHHEPSTDDWPRERSQLFREIDEFLIAWRNTDGRPPSGETPETWFYRLLRSAEHRASDIDRTLRALEDAINLASAFTGRKVLLYVSDGLPQTPALEVFEYWQSALNRSGTYVPTGPARGDASDMVRFDRSAAFRRLAQTAQRADVAIFSFDATGLRTDAGRSAEFGDTIGSLNTTSLHANQRSGLQYVAQETGGLYIANENDVEQVLARMSEQFSTYYSIGIRPPRGEVRVTVKNHPEWRVIAARRTPPQTREDKLEQSVRSRLYTRTTENPLDATLRVGTATLMENGACVAPVRVSMKQPELPLDLTPQMIELRMVMLNEQNDESAVQTATIPFVQGEIQHTMRLRIRRERLVLSTAISYPNSEEASYLQADVDGTTCR